MTGRIHAVNTGSAPVTSLDHANTRSPARGAGWAKTSA